MQDSPAESVHLSTREPSPGLWLPVVVLMVAPILMLPVSMFSDPGTRFGGTPPPSFLIWLPLYASYIWVAIASVGVLSKASKPRSIAWLLIFAGWCLSNALVMFFMYEPWFQNDPSSLICAISVALKFLLVPSVLGVVITYLALPVVTGLLIKSADEPTAPAPSLDLLGIAVIVVSLLPMACLLVGARYVVEHPVPRHDSLKEIGDQLNKLGEYDPAKQAQPTQPSAKQP